MVETWPAGLPQSVLIQGYNEAFPENSIRTANEVGPANVRGRFTSAVKPFKGDILVTNAQVDILETFYETTLNKGIDTFNWQHPRKLTSAVFRFVKAPTTVSRSNAFISTLVLEILP